MATNILGTLPSLYNVQKILENYNVKYGNRVYLDDAKDTRAKIKPSKAKNISTLSVIADNLIDYYYIQDGIKQTRSDQLDTAKTYFGLLQTIIAIVTAIAVIFAILIPIGAFVDERSSLADISNTFKIKDFKSFCLRVWAIIKLGGYTSFDLINPIPKDTQMHLIDKVLEWTIVICIIALIGFAMFFINSFSINLWNFKEKIINRLYDTSFIDKGTIQKLINMFRVSSGSEGCYYLQNASSPVAYYWALKNGTQNLYYNDNCPCYTKPTKPTKAAATAASAATAATATSILATTTTTTTTATSATTQSQTQSQTTNQNDQVDATDYLDNYIVKVHNLTPSFTDENYFKKCTDMHDPDLLYPFTASTDTEAPLINPFELKQEIQAMDLFDQINRLTSAIHFVQNFLLRSSDPVFNTVSESISASARTALHIKIANQLLTAFAIVPNVSANVSTATVMTAKTAADCYGACLEDNLYIASTFDTETKQCHLVTNSNAIAYVGPRIGATTTTTIVKNTNGQIDIGSTMAASSTGPLSGLNSNIVSNDYATLLAPIVAESTTTSAASTSQQFPFIVSATTSSIVGSNLDLSSTLTTMQTWFVGSIADMILIADPTNTFTMDMNDMSAISSLVQTSLGNNYSPVAGPLTDLLNQVPFALTQRLGNQDISPYDDIRKYIPVDRFKAKLAELDSRTFITSLVFNTNEIYATSIGVTALYDQYNITRDELHYNVDLRTKGMIWLGATFALLWIIVMVLLVKNARQLAKTKKEMNLKATNEDKATKTQTQAQDENVKFADLQALKEYLDSKGATSSTSTPNADCANVYKVLADIGDAVIGSGKKGGQGGGGSSDNDRLLKARRAAQKGFKAIEEFVETQAEEKNKEEEDARVQEKTGNVELTKDPLNSRTTLDERGLTPSAHENTQDSIDARAKQNNTDRKLKLEKIKKECLQNPINLLKKYSHLEASLEIENITDLTNDTQYMQNINAIVDLTPLVKKEENEKIIKTQLDLIKQFQEELLKKINNQCRELEDDAILTETDDNPWDALIIATTVSNAIIVTAVFLLAYFLIRNYFLKKNARDEFNKQMMDANASKLKTASTDCMNAFYADIVTNDYYGISTTVPPTTAYISSQILYDSYAATPSQPGDHMLFNAIVGNSKIDSTVILKLNNAVAIDEVYNGLIDILESYERCNSIFALKAERMPFPIVEISLYVIVLIASLLVLFLAIANLKPQCVYAIYSKWDSNLQTISQDQYNEWLVNVNCSNLATLSELRPEGQPPLFNKTTETALKFFGSAIIIVVLVLGIQQLEQNASSYSNSLYANFGSKRSCATI